MDKATSDFVKTLRFKRDFRMIRLDLGQDYVLTFASGTPFTALFMQPTPKGFNFMNYETSKCVLGRHIYPWKKAGPNTFFVNRHIKIIRADRHPALWTSGLEGAIPHHH